MGLCTRKGPWGYDLQTNYWDFEKLYLQLSAMILMVIILKNCPMEDAMNYLNTLEYSDLHKNMLCKISNIYSNLRPQTMGSPFTRILWSTLAFGAAIHPSQTLSSRTTGAENGQSVCNHEAGTDVASWPRVCGKAHDWINPGGQPLLHINTVQHAYIYMKVVVLIKVPKLLETLDASTELGTDTVCSLEPDQVWKKYAEQ